MARLPVTPDIFTPEWRARYAPQVERAMPATGEIVAPGTSVYDPDTDTWTEGYTELYYGKMRVQPLRSSSRRTAPGNTTEVLTYLISIPYPETETNFRPGNIVRVTESELNPALTTYEFVVSEIGDSSNPLEKTLMAVINQETHRG